jgi:hypothetical protein
MAKTKRKIKTPQQLRHDRYVQELRHKAKALELEVESDEVPEDDIQELDEPAADELRKQITAIEKDRYGMGDMAMPMDMPMPAPTSFEELDAMKAAQDQADEVRETSWDVQDLVRNILNDPEMDASEKSKAIKNVATGFETKLAEIISNPEDTQKDLDQLTLESILAHDKRHTNIVEQLVDKAKVSYGSRQDMPDSNFAFVTTRAGKKVRKYLIHDKSHVRNALARAAQEMNAGGEAASDAKAALPKIHAAAKKFGIGMSMKKDRNAIVIEKDASGSWRWIGWVSNNFEDTDHDIISKEAHEEYVAFLDANPLMVPAFINWHTPETMRKSLPDFWAYENGFLIMSGQLTEKEAECLLKASSNNDLGMSHGTLVLSRDLKDPRVITKYRMYEVSDLPLENAANPFTALETLSKEADMDKKAYLAQFIGEAKADELIKQTADAQKELTAAGVVSKETSPVEPPKAEVDEVMVKEIMARLDIPGLNEFVAKAQEAIDKVPLLEQALKEMAVSVDDRVAEKISPPATTLAWSKKEMRPSESDKNVVEPDNALLKNVPNAGDNWLSRATGTTPVPNPQ